MACEKLRGMRSRATALKKRIDEQRKKARAHAHKERGGRRPGHSDYVPYLQRKLNRLGSQIDRHVAQHRCQR
jgi:hypothetical protein